MIKFEVVKAEDRIDGECYLCDMKHGFIEGFWDEAEGICSGYYWQDIDFHPYVTYKQVRDTDD